MERPNWRLLGSRRAFSRLLKHERSLSISDAFQFHKSPRKKEKAFPEWPGELFWLVYGLWTGWFLSSDLSEPWLVSDGHLVCCFLGSGSCVSEPGSDTLVFTSELCGWELWAMEGLTALFRTWSHRPSTFNYDIYLLCKITPQTGNVQYEFWQLVCS